MSSVTKASAVSLVAHVLKALVVLETGVVRIGLVGGLVQVVTEADRL